MKLLCHNDSSIWQGMLGRLSIDEEGYRGNNNIFLQKDSVNNLY